MMSVVMKKVAIFLIVLAIGNCAPQKDNVSIAPSDLKQQVKYELVKSDSDLSTSTQINNDTTTKSPDTTTAPTTTDPNTTTTTIPTTTSTTTPTTSSTTTASTSTTSTSTTTTSSPIPTTSTVPTSTTPSPSTSTTTAKPEPVPPCRRFDGPSFIRGIVLTVGLIAISFVVWKFYKSRTERNYHTL